ncbi:methylmalonyl-CoA mutase subunit beta [Solwaraspora sp. WMMD406]|uniref:methylmalonyl-CoA mutase subunit beta n=1 Tax=Solwaraspora sp. WMMD406 TaxID=3016095 RepID=UPI002417B72C|nr:methylmalonyl-CoA mutase subunit beta [Solwaraspora sp. WMMD406]MDG4766028.1 methylmalonyl-CoA mutase subunit beta [Solwaraspora sp. WMMD406]
MTVPSENLGPAGDFPPTAPQQWRRLVLGVLRKSGAAGPDTPIDGVDDLLATTTYDGIRVAALHTRPATPPAIGTPGAAPFVRGAQLLRDGGGAGGTTPADTVAGWDVRARYADPDPKATREAVLTDLANGVTSVWLDLSSGGLEPADLGDALDGVHLDLAGVVLDSGGRGLPAVEAFLALAASRRTDPAELTGNLGLDPVGWQARTGEPADLSGLTDLVGRHADRYPRLRSVCVDATSYHEAGGSDAQELGCALATGVAYLRALTAAGLDVSAAFAELEFRYAATTDQFLTIAKLRAARRMWSRVAQLCGVPDAGRQRQHAVTSLAAMTARDPWVNMLRTTVACFAAGVGGADAVTVTPFDARYGPPDGFARRIARNTQSVLLAEAHLGRVLDPAGGSWYVERLTADLATVAWEWFTRIERAGGIATALATGLVAEEIEATWAERAANLAHRRDPITGVSEFPDLAEGPPRDASARPAQSGTADRPAQNGALPRRFYAQDFEACRDRADDHLAATGTRPSVFLATLGPLAAHGARVGFATNLFAAGGIATSRAGAPDDDPAAIAAAFAADPTIVACVCGTDQAYGERAAPLAAALTAAGAKRVWLAGRPAGIDHVDGYLYTGCDALAVLETTLDDLGVAR